MIQTPYAGREEAFAAFAEHVNRGKVEAFRALGVDVVLGERLGARFADLYDGRSWLNCHSNGGVFNLGHRHPAVVEAVRRALDHLDVGNHHLVSAFRADVARRLAATAGGLLPGVVFAVGGGEANDLAIKVVRGATGRPRLVTAAGAYHGHTGLALAAGDARYRDPFGLTAPDVATVPWDDLAAIDAAVDDRTAAVLLEAIPATSGMTVPSPGYLRGVERICRARGAKLVLDEVQTGLGRTGTFWSWQQDGVVPDAFTTGKGLSGGIYPIAATLLSAELFRFFDEHPFVHVSTFGGSELGCAAAGAVLDVAGAPGFLERVADLAERFRRGLAGAPYALRQRGLFMALAFGREGAAVAAMRALYEAGILAIYAGHDTSVLQLLPPLVLSAAEADEIVGIVRRTLG